MALSRKILDFIDATRAPLPPITDPNEPLHLDSLAVVRLIAFLDDDCGIDIEDEDLVTENFTNLRQLDALVTSIKSRGQASKESGTRST
jgi:acyl carrier protein